MGTHFFDANHTALPSVIQRSLRKRLSPHPQHLIGHCWIGRLRASLPRAPKQATPSKTFIHFGLLLLSMAI